MQYVTVSEVDEILGADWADTSKKERAIQQANAYLTALNLAGIDPKAIPGEVKQAGAELSRCAAEGKLYQQQAQGAVISTNVKAGSVSSAKSFSEVDQSKQQPECVQFALALLSPWRGSSTGFNVYR